MVRGEPLEQVDERGPLGGVEGCGDPTLVRAGDRRGLGQRGAAGLGEFEDVDAPVGGVAHAGDPAASLEVVDPRDHPAGRGPQHTGEGLLAEPGAHGQQAEDPRERRGQVEFGDGLGVPTGGEGTQLRQQERRSGRG